MLKSKLKPKFCGLMIFIIFFQACASIDYKKKHDIEAYNLARTIQNSNNEIKTSKGIGWLTIKKADLKTNFKIVWITEHPDKIRMTLLSSGFPVETIISNGQSITLVSHTGKHDLKTYNVKNFSLGDVLSIPLRVEDIITLLSGQIPIKDFEYAFFDTSIEISDDFANIIILKNKSDRSIQKIFLTSENQIKKYTLTDWKIKPLHIIISPEVTKVGSETISSKIIIKDNLNKEVTLEIFKLYKNLPVKTSLFNLTE